MQSARGPGFPAGFLSRSNISSRLPLNALIHFAPAAQNSDLARAEFRHEMLDALAYAAPDILRRARV
jgi:hypothetical protein